MPEPEVSARWAFLSAWVQATYLHTGPGTNTSDLCQEDRTKCRERFPLWLAMHCESAESDEQAALWWRRGEQFAGWLGVDTEMLCDLLMQVRDQEPCLFPALPGERVEVRD